MILLHSFGLISSILKVVLCRKQVLWFADLFDKRLDLKTSTKDKERIRISGENCDEISIPDVAWGLLGCDAIFWELFEIFNVF